MKLYPTKKSYAVSLTLAQFSKLDGKDFEEVERLFRDLPVERIEYNGHFGAFFFFDVTAPHEDFQKYTDEKADATARTVMAILDEYLKPKKRTT